MPGTEEIRNEIRRTLSDPTPLYALAGAGDLAVEKLREVPARVEALAADRKGTQEAAVARLKEAQAKVVGTVTTLPTDLKGLQERAQEFALQQVGRAAGLAVQAKEAYDELAVRGKGVMDKNVPGRAEEPAVTVERAETVPVDAEEVEAEEVEPAAAQQAEPEQPAKKAPRARKRPATEQ
ncbi:hypothetical protein C7C46_02550 [Streptomyces tateyamensis]|uniref:Heparin-binding hemagglutinin n=1 Tax=Streptomyces tateyamensis TaxID=565073 RepID=A0A2V4NMX9_9ACTN|nr:hypothetical protein [Streptomyces tateyamensis]PYC87932.1 hypothetical protein C7C46_02550 [Streptomyces tateyamensis]